MRGHKLYERIQKFREDAVCDTEEIARKSEIDIIVQVVDLQNTQIKELLKFQITKEDIKEE